MCLKLILTFVILQGKVFFKKRNILLEEENVSCFEAYITECKKWHVDSLSVVLLSAVAQLSVQLSDSYWIHSLFSKLPVGCFFFFNQLQKLTSKLERGLEYIHSNVRCKQNSQIYRERGISVNGLLFVLWSKGSTHSSEEAIV